MAVVTNYTGDAGLGLGGNSQIPVSSQSDLKSINDLGERIMLQNMAQNKAIYDQKLKERDQLLSQISSGDIKVGDLLEDDMPIVKKGLEDLDNAWEEMVRKGVNDLDAQKKYKSALREAQDRVTQAQGRKVFYDAESQAMAGEKVPRKQDARRGHLKNVIEGGFWKDLNPYQQTLDYDFNVIRGYAKPQETTIADPNRPLYKGKRTFYDFADTARNAAQDFVENNEAREYQQGLFNSYQSMPPDEASKELQAINNRLMEYNQERGFEPGTPEYVELKIEVDPQSGQFAIAESVPDFAAKWALANQQQYQSDVFDVDKAALDIAELDERIRHNKATEAADKNKLSLGWAEFNQKAKQAGGNEKAAVGAKEYAEGLLKKLNSLKGADGIIQPENLGKLTTDERKYLGYSTTEENKWSLNPIKIDQGTRILVEDDGTIKIFKGGTASSLGSQEGGSIDAKGIATNKLTDEMVTTTGKEGFNFNTLSDLYRKPDQKNTTSPQQQSTTTATETVEEEPYTRAELKGAGWTEKQINEAVKSGKIKVK
jgi:hypothetical protein